MISGTDAFQTTSCGLLSLVCLSRGFESAKGLLATPPPRLKKKGYASTSLRLDTPFKVAKMLIYFFSALGLAYASTQSSKRIFSSLQSSSLPLFQKLQSGIVWQIANLNIG